MIFPQYSSVIAHVSVENPPANLWHSLLAPSLRLHSESIRKLNPYSTSGAGCINTEKGISSNDVSFLSSVSSVEMLC